MGISIIYEELKTVVAFGAQSYVMQEQYDHGDKSDGLDDKVSSARRCVYVY
jgi:hypothetical protein